MTTTKQKTTLAGIAEDLSTKERCPARPIRTLEFINYGDGVSLALGYNPRARTASCIVAIVDGIAYSNTNNITENEEEVTQLKEKTKSNFEELSKKQNTTPGALIRARVEELTAKGLINL